MLKGVKTCDNVDPVPCLMSAVECQNKQNMFILHYLHFTPESSLHCEALEAHNRN